MQLERVTGTLASQATTRQEIEHAVSCFVAESNQYDVPMDEDGFYNQTLAAVAARGLRGLGGDLWLALDDGAVAAFALSHTTTDVDNSPCFWITCAYVAPKYRTTALFAESYAVLEAAARAAGSSHIILPSSRSSRAYERKLLGYHPYVVLLKKDLR